MSPLECKHGQLARSCYICELESENNELKNELERLKEELDNENKFYENYEKTAACDNSLARAVIGAKRDCRPLHECMEEWANHFLDENNALYDKLSRYEAALDCITHPVKRTTHLDTVIKELQNIARLALEGEE